MSGIQFVTDEKGRKVGVLIDLKKHGAIWEDFWEGLVSESRRKEKGIPYEQYRARRVKGSRTGGLRTHYVPTGFKGYGTGRQRSQVRLRLNATDRAVLISYLTTL